MRRYQQTRLKIVLGLGAFMFLSFLIGCWFSYSKIEVNDTLKLVINNIVTCFGMAMAFYFGSRQQQDSVYANLTQQTPGKEGELTETSGEDK